MARWILRDLIVVACTTAALITPARADSGSSAKSGASRRGFVTHTNFDLEGGDLSRFQGASQDACERSCSETDDCVAYSYDKWNRWCFLKNGLGLMRFEPKCVIGLLKDAGEPKRATTAIIMQRYRGKEFPVMATPAGRADRWKLARRSAVRIRRVWRIRSPSRKRRASCSMTRRSITRRMPPTVASKDSPREGEAADCIRRHAPAQSAVRAKSVNRTAQSCTEPRR